MDIFRWSNISSWKKCPNTCALYFKNSHTHTHTHTRTRTQIHTLIFCHLETHALVWVAQGLLIWLGKAETLLCVFSVQCSSKCTGKQIMPRDIYKLVTGICLERQFIWVIQNILINFLMIINKTASVLWHIQDYSDSKSYMWAVLCPNAFSERSSMNSFIFWANLNWTYWTRSFWRLWTALCHSLTSFKRVPDFHRAFQARTQLKHTIKMP